MSALDRARARLFVHSEQPLNAEAALPRLAGAFLTSQRDLYIRSHGDIPQVDAAAYRLRVTGAVAQPLELSVADLRVRFRERSVTCALQCAGNRRADLQAVAPTAGDPWRGGAIGNVRWTGVALRDVLEAAGVSGTAGLQVAFYGSDDVEVDGSSGRYGVSIPLAKALSPDVLLAFDADGGPLAPEHGFPLRAVVPGYAGVRSAKWLCEVRVQAEPADSPIQRRDYKLFPPDVGKDEVDWSAGLTIDALPLNSAICTPERGAALQAGPLTVTGWAAASERRVVRVDVSVDGGRRWAQARLEQDPDQPHAWTLWRLDVELARGAHELVVRAWDEAMQTQPDTPDDTWNFAGYLAAHRHRVPVTVS